MSRPLYLRALALTLVTALLSFTATALLAAPAGAVEAGSAAGSEWAYLAAALATGLSSLGAGYAVAMVGSSAIGAIAEKPELFGRLLIFVGLAEGIAIYGVIISILILNRV